MGNPVSLRFVADNMLGSLARKLRLLGIDTAYIRDTDDSELKYLVRSQSRILLTRDMNLSRNLGDLAWLVTGRNAREEFLSISKKLSIADCQPDPFSRCLECNEELVPLNSTRVRDKVPPYVLESKASFFGCPSCERVYWEGTHSKRMGEEVEWMKDVLQGEGRLD
jgi:uncharacterized protein with PIN domain